MLIAGAVFPLTPRSHLLVFLVAFDCQVQMRRPVQGAPEQKNNKRDKKIVVIIFWFVMVSWGKDMQIISN